MPNRAHADCTINRGETINVSNGALNGCSGTVTILGTLVIDATLNLSLSGISTIIIDEGTIQWTGNHDLILPPNLSIQIINGGSVSASNACNADKRIIFGLEVVVTCNGNGDNLSFVEINAAGGFNSAALLPVELIAFDAELMDRGVELNWITASEKNNNYFKIEQSFDGIQWNTIGEVAGKGTVNQLSYYSFEDNRTYQTDINYYRLKQVDFDGTSTYSDIITIDLKYNEGKEIEINVFPNPASEYLSIDLSTPFDKDISIVLVDVNGNRIPLDSDLNSETITLIIPATLASGPYAVHVMKNGQILSKKWLMVQKSE